MKKLAFLTILLLATGCATTGTKSIEEVQVPKVSSLDKNKYVVSVNAKNFNSKLKKRASIIFINSQMKQKGVNVNAVNLRHWISNSLSKKGYYIDRLGPLINFAILVEYGIEPISSREGQEEVMFNRYIKLSAIDYAKFKQNKKVNLLWETKIHSVGPDSDLSKILPIVAGFLNESVETDLSKEYVLDSNDPRLESTKEVPTTIPVDDFKPTLDELNFFN